MQDLFPNILTLFHIACTIPVTSCECERSASALRRLHTFYRAAMNEDRLTGLALIHIHYGHRVDLDNVVDLFKNSHPRRFELGNLFDDE
jgi:hypothetical protein